MSEAEVVKTNPQSNSPRPEGTAPRTFTGQRPSFSGSNSDRSGSFKDREARRFASRRSRFASKGGPSSGPSSSSNGNSSNSNSGRFQKNDRGGKKSFRPQVEEIESRVITVRRVTRVVKGGKRMKFSALVVVGDRMGKVGFGLRKGIDYQDAVAKALKKAKENTINIKLNEESSISFPSKFKFKSCMLYLKPAKTGTGIIAGGFLRPVLELCGVKNVYSKVIRSRNKVAGVEAAFEALKQYQLVETQI